MTRYAELKRLTQLKAERDIAELARCLAVQDAILAELNALADLQAQKFEQLAPEGPRLEATWQTWQSSRATALRQRHALARAEVLEARARAEETAGEARCLAKLHAKDQAKSLAAKAKRQADTMDDLLTLKTFIAASKPGR